MAVVRHALAGLAESIGMDEAGVADLKTVVTEACMNVVVHAYPSEEPGQLEVEAEPRENGLAVLVRDFGTGIRPRADSDRPSLRIGLTLIAALSSSFEIRGGVGRGTEIGMELPLHARSEEDIAAIVPGHEGGDEATRLRVGSPQLLGPILGRALGALAARREITVDRLADAMLLSDAISARAGDGFDDGRVSLSILDAERGVELRVGPMVAGGGTRLRESLELPDVGGSLESLADVFEVENGDDGEYLVVGIVAVGG